MKVEQLTLNNVKWFDTLGKNTSQVNLFILFVSANFNHTEQLDDQLHVIYPNVCITGSLKAGDMHDFIVV